MGRQSRPILTLFQEGEWKGRDRVLETSHALSPLATDYSVTRDRRIVVVAPDSERVKF